MPLSSICDMPAPAGARYLAMSRCEPALIRLGASSSPTSEKRKSIRSARPRDVTRPATTKKSCVSFASQFVAWKAHVDVPARHHRGRPGEETALPRNPAPRADQLIEGRCSPRSETALPISGEPNDWPYPRRQVVWIAGNVTPHRAGLCCPFLRKCTIHAHDPIFNELVDLCAAERTRARIVGHEISLSTTTRR